MRDSFGTRIRKARMDAGYSRPEVAFELGVAPAYIGRMEAEEVCPTIAQVKQLAALYNVSLEWLCMMGEKAND